MSHCEFKLAKAETEEELERAVRIARQDGWYRTSPNRTAGEVPVASEYYCVLSRIHGSTGGKFGAIRSLFEGRRAAFWRG